MRRLERIAGFVDTLNELVGTTVAWLILFMVLGQFALVLMRYVFGIASIFVQETFQYAHAIVFLAAVGYAMRHEAHVRIDIFYAKMGTRTRMLVDLLGTLLFLVPTCCLVLVTSWGYVATSWSSLETSRDTAGIPAVFLLKSFILVFAVLVLAQGLAMAIRSTVALSDGSTRSSS